MPRVMVASLTKAGMLTWGFRPATMMVTPRTLTRVIETNTHHDFFNPQRQAGVLLSPDTGEGAEAQRRQVIRPRFPHGQSAETEHAD